LGLSVTAYTVSYHPDVKAIDLPKIDRKNRERIRKAIEERLLARPEAYGQKLQRTLKDYWKLRVGPYRIVFKMTGNHITVLGIIHRKDVYQDIERRLE
jgi:mRNA interferase RelE/StbE